MSSRFPKALLLWVNDGLMAIFFLLVGLELKREIIQGHLSSMKEAILPGVAAVGGMLGPALFYVAFNYGDPVAMRGWAIPAATDIAFALGVMALLGPRVPAALKVFLLSVAIFDDLGAIIIIALFYTSKLSIVSLYIAAVFTLILSLLNMRRVTSLTPYILIGVVLWVAVLKSGVHATLAGVLVAFFIPIGKDSDGDDHSSPLHHLEHSLHPWVAFGVLPVFAFFNAGVSVLDLSVTDVFHPVPLGIAGGLLVGKQVGIFGACILAVKLKLASLPGNITWKQLYATGILCGIGFTMSLFIAGLAFEDGSSGFQGLDRLGILLGSFISGILGYLLLRNSLAEKSQEAEI